MSKTTALAALALALFTHDASAQFASDFPGVPRASISIRGSTQSRVVYSLQGAKIPGATAAAGDTLSGGLRIGYGQSYRIQGQFEAGWDVTLADAFGMQPPKSTTSTVAAQDIYARATVGYGLRVGGKWRPVSALDENGYGYELSVGGAYQPEFKPLYGYEMKGDSNRAGGQFIDKKASTVFKQNSFAAIHSTVTAAGMASYRSKRWLGDAAVVSETSPDRALTVDPSPLTVYTGVSIRAGGVFKLSPGLAVGGSFWGDGSPPWLDQPRINVSAKANSEKFGVLIQLGSSPEAGLDLMYTSPTGNYAQSGRLYIRTRATY